MPVRVKTNSSSNVGPAYGGSWSGTIANGNIRSRWGAGWFTPTTIRRKMGDIGAVGGYWHDTGYVGLPSTPTSIAVYSWPTHSAASFYWTPGAGGAAVDHYVVGINDQSNTVGVSYTNHTSTISSSIPLSPSTKYNVHVIAVSSTGQVSNWYGPLKIVMGKDAVATSTPTQKTRDWSGSVAIGTNGYLNNPVGVSVPTSVRMTSINYDVTSTGFTSILSPYNHRTINRWFNGADEGVAQAWPSPANRGLPYNVTNTINLQSTSASHKQGFICRGAGWATSGANTDYRVIGNVTVSGTETYTENVAGTIPAVANGYW